MNLGEASLGMIIFTIRKATDVQSIYVHLSDVKHLAEKQIPKWIQNKEKKISLQLYTYNRITEAKENKTNKKTSMSTLDKHVDFEE